MTNHVGQQFDSYHPGRPQPHPLIGREQERQLWYQQFSEIEQALSKPTPANSVMWAWERPSHTACLLFYGEAGIGKTRLAEEMSQEARQRGWAVVWSRLYAQERGMPYHLWIEALRAALSQGLWSQQAGNQCALVYQPLTALLPELADLRTPEPLLTGSSPGSEQTQLWETILMVFVAMCEHQPLLLVLDDLQYADTISCELLSYLVRHFSQYPILIVGTYRNHEVPSTHPLYLIMAQLQRERVLMIHQITALTDAQIGELISDLPEALVQHIQSQAAGNPFFAEELARVFAERGMAGRHDVPSSPISPLPETITAVLRQHLRQLSDPCQRFLSYAAILGNAFTFSTIHVMMGGSSIARDEETLLTLIDEALQAHVLMEEGHGSWIIYRFWHPLFIDHIYQELSSTRRAVLHRKAAEALRQVYATYEEEGAVLIMHHLLRSDAEASQIAHYAELAGRRAHTLAAYPEAERYYRIALEQGEGITASWPQGKWLSITGENKKREHIAYLLECLAECTRLQGKPDVARDLYQRILQMRDQPDAEGSAVERQEKAQFQAMLWCEMGVTWYDTGDYEQALQCYQQCEQILMEAGVTTGPVWARIRVQQSYVYWEKVIMKRLSTWH